MISILAEIQVEDYARFIPVFTTRGKEARIKNGCLKSQVYRCEDPTKLIVLFDWESKEKFEGFLTDPFVKEAMKLSGTTAPPKFTFLDKACEIPG